MAPNNKVPGTFPKSLILIKGKVLILKETKYCPPYRGSCYNNTKVQEPLIITGF